MPVTLMAEPREPQGKPQVRRPVWPAIANGLRLKCPRCGKGHMFRAYLKVADSCEHCGEVLHLHKADDLPPYLTIVVVGHVLVGLMLHLESSYTISPMAYMATLVPLAAILPLLLLPPIKGGVVALQWAKRMHGFALEDDEPVHSGYR